MTTGSLCNLKEDLFLDILSGTKYDIMQIHFGDISHDKSIVFRAFSALPFMFHRVLRLHLESCMLTLGVATVTTDPHINIRIHDQYVIVSENRNIPHTSIGRIIQNGSLTSDQAKVLKNIYQKSKKSEVCWEKDTKVNEKAVLGFPKDPPESLPLTIDSGETLSQLSLLTKEEKDGIRNAIKNEDIKKRWENWTHPQQAFAWENMKMQDRKALWAGYANEYAEAQRSFKMRNLGYTLDRCTTFAIDDTHAVKSKEIKKVNKEYYLKNAARMRYRFYETKILYGWYAGIPFYRSFGSMHNCQTFWNDFFSAGSKLFETLQKDLPQTVKIQRHSL